MVAVSDPLQQGWDLFGTAFYEPSLTWLPTSALWSIQVGAVIVGHIVGAWAGHAVAPGTRHRPRPRAGSTGRPRRADLRAQLPLAILMVGLTALTLWSLGQRLVFETEPQRPLPAMVVGPR